MNCEHFGKIVIGQTFCSEGSANGLEYTSEAREWLFVDGEEQPEASICTLSFFKKNAEENRPVIFFVEGGPGASAWFGCSTLGPIVPDYEKCGSKPPFCFKENDNWILDTCDLVLIDVPGTGYARLYNLEKESLYFGSENDAGICVKIIKEWLDKNDRWNSPKFLFGGSYGSTRAAITLDYALGATDNGRLQKMTEDLFFDGAILYSQTLTFDLSRGLYVPDGVNECVTDLPSIAATYHYYSQDPSLPDVKTFVDEAWDFAASEYAPALVKGASMTPEEREHIKERLTYFTGLPGEALEQLHLKLIRFAYQDMLLAGQERHMGQNDTRTSSGSYGNGRVDGAACDPSVIGSALNAAGRREAEKLLNIHFDREFRRINFEFLNELVPVNWDYTSVKSPLEHLSSALNYNSGLKIMLAGGYYDFATPIGDARYMLNTAGLPLDRITHKEYAGNHEVFLDPACSEESLADLRQFIHDTLED